MRVLFLYRTFVQKGGNVATGELSPENLLTSSILRPQLTEIARRITKREEDAQAEALTGGGVPRSASLGFGSSTGSADGSGSAGAPAAGTAVGEASGAGSGGVGSGGAAPPVPVGVAIRPFTWRALDDVELPRSQSAVKAGSDSAPATPDAPAPAVDGSVEGDGGDTAMATDVDGNGDGGAGRGDDGDAPVAEDAKSGCCVQ